MSGQAIHYINQPNTDFFLSEAFTLLPYSILATCPTHLNLLDIMTLTILGERSILELLLQICSYQNFSLSFEDNDSKGCPHLFRIPQTLNHTVQDPRAARLYLFSDGQNIYNRIVLVYTLKVYIPASLGRQPNLRYQVLQVRIKLYSLYLQSED